MIHSKGVVEPWIWLFPATYILHILEESLGGERFYAWIRRVTGRAIPAVAFFALNGIFFLSMIIAVVALRAGEVPWLLPALGTLTTINGLGHLAGTFATRTYSPGLVSGVLLWIPLGIAALWLSRPSLSSGEWWLGIATRLLMSGVVVGLALVTSRRASPA